MVDSKVPCLRRTGIGNPVAENRPNRFANVHPLGDGDEVFGLVQPGAPLGLVEVARHRPGRRRILR
jgi:hypothetical protein